MYGTWTTVRGHITDYLTAAGEPTKIATVVDDVATAESLERTLVRHALWHGIANNKLKFVWGWKVDTI